MIQKTNQIEVNLMTVLRRISRGKYVLLATTMVGIVTAFVLVKTTKPYYFSSAQFLPPHYTDLSGNGGASALLLGGGMDASDLYLGLLVSRTVQDDVVNHIGLREIYHAPNQSIARFVLQKNSIFAVGRNSLVFVNVKADDPQLAARIANAYLDALYRLNGTMVSSSSDARRVFYQQQLNEERAHLDKAEQAFAEMEETTGVVLPGGVAEAGLGATAQLQAQINASEERLTGLLVGATDQNPEVIQARAQIAQLRTQMARQQQDTNEQTTGLPSARRLPRITLKYQEKERDVKQAEAAYDALLQQYARARLATIDPGPQLEVVDRAVPAEMKSGPDRRLIMELGVVLGFLPGLLYLIIFEPLRHVLRRWRDTPVEVTRSAATT